MFLFNMIYRLVAIRNLVVRSIVGFYIVGSSQLQAGDIRSQLLGMSPAPAAYWPFEYGFIPEKSAGTYQVVARERNGPTLDFAVFQDDQFVYVDFFPILPDHSTVAAGTTALVISEPNGFTDPQGTDRRLTIIGGPSNSDLTAELGLSGSWSVHLIVYPEPDFESPERGSELVFEVIAGGDAIRLECVTTGTMTSYQMAVIDEQYPRNDIITTVEDVPINGPSGPGHQILIVFDAGVDVAGASNSSSSGLTLDVNGIQAFAEGPSAGIFGNGVTGRLDIGADDPGNKNFHGALHHLAFWDSNLFETGAEVGLRAALRTNESRADLKSVWSDPENFYSVPIFYTWVGAHSGGDAMIDNVSIAHQSNPRNFTDWDDPIWDYTELFPMVRVFLPETESILFYTAQELADRMILRIDDFEHGLNLNGRSLTDAGPGYGIYWQNWTVGVSTQQYEEEYSLDARTRLMRNWRDVPYQWRAHNDGSQFVWNSLSTVQHEMNSPFYTYGMSRMASKTQQVFEILGENLNMVSSSSINGDFPPPSRIHLDLEQNARYSLAVSKSDSDENLGWWTEAFEDPRAGEPRYWGSPSETLLDLPDDPTGMYQVGKYGYPDPNRNWWEAENVGFFNRASSIRSSAYEHAIYNGIIVPASDALGHEIRWSVYNLVNSGEFDPLVDGEYSFSNIIAENDILQDNVIGGGKVRYSTANTSLELADFSGPVLYPVRDGALQSRLDWLRYWEALFPGEQFIDLDSLTGEQSENVRPYPLRTSEWACGDGATVNGCGDFTEAPIEPVLEDLDNLFVEIRKHDLNAIYLATRNPGPQQHTPIAPWLPIPGSVWDANGDPEGSNQSLFKSMRGTPGDMYPDIQENDTDLPYTVKWQEVARLAVFAYRRGVREFLLWGSEGVYDSSSFYGKPKEYTEELEKVLDAVRFARAITDDGTVLGWRDRTTSGHVSRFDHSDFGVPDGNVDLYDLKYFIDRWEELDMEADITGAPGGVPDGVPDGVVDQYDYWLYRSYVGCSGDLNCNGSVENYDAIEWGGAYSVFMTNPSTYNFKADLNLDGVIDLADFSILYSQWSASDHCFEPSP